jgi:hypothetical protein
MVHSAGSPITFSTSSNCSRGRPPTGKKVGSVSKSNPLPEKSKQSMTDGQKPASSSTPNPSRLVAGFRTPVDPASVASPGARKSVQHISPAEMTYASPVTRIEDSSTKPLRKKTKTTTEVFANDFSMEGVEERDSTSVASSNRRRKERDFDNASYVDERSTSTVVKAPALKLSVSAVKTSRLSSIKFEDVKVDGEDADRETSISINTIRAIAEATSGNTNHKVSLTDIFHKLLYV